MAELHPGGSRKQRAQASELTELRQKATLELVQATDQRGVTVAEIMDTLGIGHGQASSALSHLHRTEEAKRLKERRNGQEIYVLPKYVGERKESPYNMRLNQRKHPRFSSDRTVMEAMTVAGLPLDPDAYDRIRKFLEALP